MTLTVLQYPDPRLRQVATKIDVIDDSIRAQAKAMIETMYHEDAAALAATQVDFHKRMFVMDLSKTGKEPRCLINPVIVEKKGEIIAIEGCVSFPGVYTKVKRAKFVVVEYQDLEGNHHTESGDGIFAKGMQHEIDHLDGVVFIDHLSKLKQMLFMKKYEKAQKMAQP